jgi:hypothetical protein
VRATLLTLAALVCLLLWVLGVAGTLGWSLAVSWILLGGAVVLLGLRAAT